MRKSTAVILVGALVVTGLATTQFLHAPAARGVRHEFVPTQFHRQFSASVAPVLTVKPGDVIHTTLLDATGMDERGISRSPGGNPQTGPFLVAGATAGDTLAVHLTRVRLNRDWALSDDAVVARAIDPSLAAMLTAPPRLVRWHLDRARGIATPEGASGRLRTYSVPLRPMLGGIAVAPPEPAAPAANDSGIWGGNLDFNEIVEGATVFLPVHVAGALLYVGDGHAAQGDGELTGNALETSMAVDLQVDLAPMRNIPGPRVESPTHIMAIGLAGSLDDALRAATANMADWLTRAYSLSGSEIAQVLGTSAQYSVSEVADRNVGIVLKIARRRLDALTVSGVP